MTLLRQYRVASLMLVLLSIVAFSIAELDFAMLVVGVVLAVLSWYVTEGPRGRTMPNWATNTLTAGLFAYCAADFVVREDKMAREILAVDLGRRFEDAGVAAYSEFLRTMRRRFPTATTTPAGPMWTTPPALIRPCT